MAKKLMIFGIAVVFLFSLAACEWSGGLIDPNDFFDSLDEMQAALPDDFYYFDFDDQKLQANGYQAETNTQSYYRRSHGDFNYIGYSISFLMQPLNSSYGDEPFYVSAFLEKSMDKVLEDNNITGLATIDRIMIDDIECILNNDPEAGRQLYFAIENVCYCFKIKNLIDKTEFLSICEPAVLGRFKVAREA